MSDFNAYYNPEIVAQISAAGITVQNRMEGMITGLHRSPLHGVSPEFSEYRSYTPGDDLRNVDWRVYARSDRYFIKRFEEESNLRANIVLDASASMNYGRQGTSKFQYAATLAASLAAALIKQRDAVGLTTFNTAGENHLPVSSMESQIRKMCEALASVRPAGETDLAGVLSSLADQMPRRGMVVLISDLFTDLDPLYEAIGKVQYCGHEMLVFHVLDREEVEMPFRGSVLFRDIEGVEEVFAEPRAFRKAYQRAIRDFMNDVHGRCQFCAIDYLALFTDQEMGPRISDFLRERSRSGARKHRGKMSLLGDE